MKRKTKTELRKRRNRLPTADYALHCRLRDILTKEGPCRFAKLRNEHGIDPIDLERQHQRYPDVFYVVESEQGRFPVMALHENPPSREDSLMKKQLVILVQKAGATGFISQACTTRRCLTPPILSVCVKPFRER